ncbi:MAG: hypothetical protein PHQ27_07370 [Victivallales bacterium]|nr:hypothetical protein [Victivallales bacterium]
MKKHDFDDLDEMIAELEDSLGMDTAEYLEEDYLDTIGAFEDDKEFDLKEFKDFEDEFSDTDDSLESESGDEGEMCCKHHHDDDGCGDN